ncbi:DUF6274 family protein [Streptomyces sp. BE230]|uniref:DUF6274 family protein n=1 Tax=Streptomyces sp. BE230 TaxID=3002526 RepID=UPI002ED3E373|nr:DUF6274 family protein [Streptomyces sp. BE230]
MAVSTGEGFLPDRSGAREPAPGPARRRAPRHEIRALLRAHLAAASGYRHLTRHCAVCARLLRLAMEPLTAPGPPEGTAEPLTGPRAPEQTTRPVTAPGPPEQTTWLVTTSRPPEQTAIAPRPPEQAAIAPRPPEQTATTPRPPEQTAIASRPPEQTAGPVIAPGPPGLTTEPATGPGAPQAAVEPSHAAPTRRSDRPQPPARTAPSPLSAPPDDPEEGPAAAATPHGHRTKVLPPRDQWLGLPLHSSGRLVLGKTQAM